MLTGLKVSPLACKCGFYRPEHNAKGEPWWEKWGDLSIYPIYSQSYGH